MTKKTERAFNETYKLYRHRVFGMAFKILKDVQMAEDVTQDVFIKLLKQTKKIDEDHQIQWLCVVARNTSLKILTKTKRVELCESLDSLTLGNFRQTDGTHIYCHLKAVSRDSTVCMDDPSSLLSNAERSSDRGRAVLAAIARLPSRLQKLLKLRFFDRLSYAEIAKKTKLSKGNVGFLLNKATTTLRKKLNNARRELNEV